MGAGRGCDDETSAFADDGLVGRGKNRILDSILSCERSNWMGVVKSCFTTDARSAREASRAVSSELRPSVRRLERDGVTHDGG